MSEDRERTLRALRILRERAESDAQAALAAALRAEARAQARVEEARQALRDHRATTRAALTGEAGGPSAFALQQAQRFRAGRSLGERALRRRLARAEVAAAEASQTVLRARHTLSQCHAERRALDSLRDGT